MSNERNNAGPVSKFIEQANALLRLDDANALAPHGIGGFARELLTEAIRLLSEAPAVPQEWRKDLFTIVHAMGMNNWHGASDASNELKREAYSAAARLYNASAHATPAAPSQEPAVPKGERSEAAIDAGFAALEARGFRATGSYIGRDNIWAVFTAMLAASPAQPATEQACQTKGDCKRYGCNGACSSATEHPDSPVYTWESRDCKQHDTGRVMRGGKSFFADTASPQDARLIAEALNAYVAAKPDAQSVVWIATRLWNARELWTCPADIERMLATAPAAPSQPVIATQTSVTEDDVAMAWNTVRAEARALGGKTALAELLTAVEQYADRRVALASQEPVTLTDEVLEHLIEDLSEWSRHVVEDTAHQTLEAHVREVLANSNIIAALRDLKGGM